MSRRLLTASSLAAALCLAGCPGDDVLHCAGAQCSDICCAVGQVCDPKGACCSPTSCENRKCGTDGCGTSCGSCAAGTACSEVTWTCDPCAPETREAFCGREAVAGKVCGQVQDADICTGETRTEDCNACTDGHSCAADNTCSGPCVARTVAEFCAAAKKSCGSYTGQDCGQARTEDCGNCAKGKCRDNVCSECTYEGDLVFCSRLAAAGKVCGAINAADNCGDRRTVDCGTAACLTIEQCDPATNTCQSCTPENTDQFCSRLAQLGKRCGTIDAEDNCGHPRSEDCGDKCAASGNVCRDYVCVPPAVPPNDTCAGAQALTFSSDVATVTGDTTLAKADLKGSCSADASGPDVVYSFSLDKARKVQVDVTAVGSRHLSPVVYLRTSCSTASSELACVRGFSDASLAVNHLAPGTYFVVVDSQSPTYVGPFDLKVTLGTPDPVPANDTCAGAIDLGSLSMPVDGTTVAATNDSAGSCAAAFFPQDGADVVYQFTVPEGAQSSAKIQVVAAPGSVFHPAVYVRTDCASAASELACAGYQGGGETGLYLLKLAAGTYFIVVDGESQSQGAFQISLTLGPAIDVPDHCSQAKALDVSQLDAGGNGTLTVSGDTSLATDDTSSTLCNAGFGPDLVYSLTTDPAKGPKDIRVTLTFDDPKTTPVVYVRGGACDTSDQELGCADGMSRNVATLQLRSIEGGTYYLWADDYNGTSGSFVMTVDIADAAPVPSNDACGPAGANATLIPLDSKGHATITGDTSLAAGDDARAICGLADGRDLVYLIDTTGLGLRDLSATLSFAGTADAALYLWRLCDPLQANNEIACAMPLGQMATVRVNRLPEGKYYLWADEARGDEGPFTLVVDASVPLPSPCLDATDVDVHTGQGTASGSTLDTTDHTRGSCAGDQVNDAVFKFTTTAQQQVTLTVVPDPASVDFRPGVYLRKSDCDSEATKDELVCAAAEHAEDSVVAVYGDLDPGTYWVWVDGYSGTGDFQLQVKLDPPVIPPSNDRCGPGGANAIALKLGGGPVAGDTTTARADYGFVMSNACVASTLYNAPGRDLVYSYTPAASGGFLVVLVPDNWDAQLWMTVGTCGGDGDTCTQAADESGPGGAESLLVDGVAGTTYYLYADCFVDDFGPFTIEIQQPAPQPTNDTCGVSGENAIVLVPGVFVSGDTTYASADYGDSLSPSCLAETGDYNAPGHDLVYRYTPAASGKFTIELAPDGWDAFLWITKDTCGGDGSACLHARESAGPGEAEWMNVDGVAGTDYYIYADRWSDGAPGGPFKIVVNPPRVVPPNDTCGVNGANALPLVLGAPPTPGDTTNANPDYGDFVSAACYADTGYSAAGNDLVYRYTPSVSGPFTVELVPQNWDACLWYTINVCGGDGSACVHASDKLGSGGTESLTVEGVAGTTYFFYADRFASDSFGGPFTIQVK